MSKISVAAKKVGDFIKKNAFYLLILLCIASVATIIALAASGDFGGETDPGAEVVLPDPDDDGNEEKPDEPDEPDKPDQPDQPEKPVLSFVSPVSGTVSQSYSDSALVWNPTLGQYEVHLGVDFTGEDLSVLASEAGTVSDIINDPLDGVCVVIDHADGYQTRYCSLDENVQVAKGDTVEKGQIIGNMAATRGSESLAGNHLHFEMLKDGELIDPLGVLVLEEK